MTDELMNCLRLEDSLTFAKISQNYMQGKILLNDALNKIKLGITTVSEIIRIIG